MEQENLLPIRILHDFAERLENIGIGYMLTGAMAMMSYSVYRFTADADVVLELETHDANRIIEAFEPDYYLPHFAVSRAVAEKRMFNVIHQETAFKIDCIIKKSTAFQKHAFERRERSDFYGRKIWIINKEDLIISKLWWAKDNLSEKHLTDVRNLIKTGIDVSYIEKWTNDLGVYDLFEQFRKEIQK